MATNHIDMTATEMGYLWSTYQAETLNYCMLTYFNSIAEDPEIKQLNASTLQSCKNNINRLKEIFGGDTFPIPVGFGDNDLIQNSERLYTDPFILYFQWFIGKGNLNYSSKAINTIARDDVFSFYEDFSLESLKLLKNARQTLLSKGLWIRAPYIPIPESIDYVKKESFLNGWFGDERPLAGIEIASIFYNIITNTLGLSLMQSFAQVTHKGDVHKYIMRGKAIAEKHIDALSTLLQKENIPTPTTWNAGVTASTESPFSEKLMLYLVSFLNAQGISNYGDATSTIIRRDVGLAFSRLAAEIAAFAEDGTELLISKGWMEMPPQAKKKLK
ncbi:DUF3231 family protein [Bacillus sp. HMF5848]|uniref:DUF3231 family protein n=1 Tax=Bacillus sp. HMF5848 TaxID=2495421 RepID=UPI000F785E99|nr:DUF3231 family protein [Bacillus sp. HMF5848]RSK25905.1 DUF3231 family protein [Bacillus sp. HMF5848]